VALVASADERGPVLADGVRETLREIVSVALAARRAAPSRWEAPGARPRDSSRVEPSLRIAHHTPHLDAAHRDGFS